MLPQIERMKIYKKRLADAKHIFYFAISFLIAALISGARRW